MMCAKEKPNHLLSTNFDVLSSQDVSDDALLTNIIEIPDTQKKSEINNIQNGRQITGKCEPKQYYIMQIYLNCVAT